MVKQTRGKSIHLKSGYFSGIKWDVQIYVIEGREEHPFYYTFTKRSDEQKERDSIRSNDRTFFKRRLGEAFMSNKIVHHNWNSGDGILWTYVKDKSEHNFGGLGTKIDRHGEWIKREDWLEKIGEVFNI